MTGTDAMRSVVVVGGGITAWTAAAALKRHIPTLAVTVVDCGVPANALADGMICTLPSIGGFHADLGLGTGDTVARVASGLRIGTMFEGWNSERQPYVHAYGSIGTATQSIPFHQLWLRARADGGDISFDEYSVAAMLAKTGRVAAGSTVAEVGYGLHLTLERYARLMRDFATHLGVSALTCDRFDVRLRAEDGFVEALILTSGETIAADLFVDCTGPGALVRRPLEGDFEDWSRWLPCDRILLADAPPEADMNGLDRVTAFEFGWRWAASSPARGSLGLVYSSAHASDEKARGSFAPDKAQLITLRQGRWAEPWLRNCVAVGDAAVCVEPLEWTNLHLAHSQIDRIIAMMPGPDCAAVELHEYNRQCGDEADRLRDFLCMHYVTAKRTEPFWKDAASIDLPGPLDHALSLFAERGRLPYYEEATFTRDSWLAVLFGQGFEPRRVDPLADSISYEEARAELSRYADFVRSFVDTQPRHQEVMSSMFERLSR